MITTPPKMKETTIPKRSISFNGNASQFAWWKSKIYSHVMSIDDELWDIVEDGIEIEVNEEGRTLDRKGLAKAKKKI